MPLNRQPSRWTANAMQADHDQPKDNHEVRLLSQPNPELLEDMVRLFDQGQAPHHTAFPDHFGPANDIPAITGYLRGFFKPRNPFRTRRGFAKGWFVDDQLSGYLLYYLQETSNIFYGKTRWTCFVEDIVIGAEARSLGGASQLITALLAELEPLADCAISATVWSGNEASDALFRKHGFEALSKSFYRVSK